MSSTTHAPSNRSANVIMGRQNYISTLLRSIGGELYKIRRRSMSKILGSIAIIAMIVSFAGSSFPAFLSTEQSVSAFLPPSCSSHMTAIGEKCLQGAPSSQDMAQAVKARQQYIHNSSASLRLPDSLNMAGSVATFIGTILLIILAGTIVGGEYTVGSIRLMLTRGPTRTQFLLAKIGTMLTCVFLLLIPLLLIGILTGALFSMMVGAGYDFSFLTGHWLLFALLYILATALSLFTYSLLAIGLATLGKATAAGVTGALIWWFLEDVASQLFKIVGSFNKGAFGSFLQAIPNYFIGNNLSALRDNLYNTMTNTTSSTDISTLHATLVILAYLILFSGITWWVLKTRDVTN